MSNWTHDLLVIVPENLITEGNALALAVGTCEADVETFKHADFVIKAINENTFEYIDEDGTVVPVIEKVAVYGTERFAIAHTKAVDKIVEYFSAINITENTDQNLTTALSQTLCINVDFTNIDMTKIQIIFDVEPFDVLNKLSLVRI